MPARGEVGLQMSTQPPCSGVEGTAGKHSTRIRLEGGHAEKPRIIAAYRAGQHVDVEVHSADGTPYRAHALVLMATSDYFDAAYTGGWADASGPHVLPAVPTAALDACLEWIYTGTCVASDDSALLAILMLGAEHSTLAQRGIDT